MVIFEVFCQATETLAGTDVGGLGWHQHCGDQRVLYVVRAAPKTEQYGTKETPGLLLEEGREQFQVWTRANNCDTKTRNEKISQY